MSATELLKKCKSKGIALELVDGQLRYRAPVGEMDEDLKKSIREQKLNIIKILEPDFYHRHIQTVIAELNHTGARIMDVPAVNRKRSLELEQKMTQAANEGNQEKFLKFLKEWRDCFQ